MLTRLHLRSATLVPRVAALLIAWLGACGNEVRHEPPPPASSGRAAPIVEFAGCSGAAKPPQELRCTLPAAPRVIQLFVSASSVPLVEVDGTPANARTTPTIAERGWTVAVDVPPTATRMTVRDADAEPADAAWTMTFDRIAPTPTVDAIEAEVPDMNSPGRTPALLKAIEKLETIAPSLDPMERHKALRFAIQLALDAGQQERVRSLGQRALRESLDTNRIFHVVELAEILLHSTTDDAEQEWLLRLLEIGIEVAGDGQHEVRWRYARAIRAEVRGDIGSALDDYARSERSARRLGLVSDELAAAGPRTGLLALVGDPQASDRARERILGLVIGRPSSQACVDASVLLGAAWNLLVRRLLGDDQADPASLLHRVAGYFGTNGGCDVGENPMLKRAFAELQLHVARDATTRDDPELERRAIAAIDPVSLNAGQRRWLSYVQAHLAAKMGDRASALRSTERLVDSAAEQPLLAWKTALLRADLRGAQHDDKGALAEVLAAESVLDKAAGTLAPDQGREGMADVLQVSAKRAVTLQLAAGDVNGASATARRARARRLRPIGSTAAVANLPAEKRVQYQRARTTYNTLADELATSLTGAWRLSAEARLQATRRNVELQDGMREALKEADEILREVQSPTMALMAPVPGEVALLFHPVSDGWVGFAISSQRTDVEHFSLAQDMTEEAASARLLLPFSDAIARARRVRILAVGELLQTRVHALPWEGAPLIFAKSVAYGLDLDGAPLGVQGSREALVVSDPATRVVGLGRLPLAAEEGVAVRTRLESRGWTVRALTGEETDKRDVVDALVHADWLHYAGHGVASGGSGWDSALPLKGEASLDVRDILSAPRVPSAIVLSACDAGGAARSLGASTQISTAFILAGSSFVIAAQGSVSDEAAFRYSAALYDSLTGDLDGPELARQAVLTLHAAGEPMSTWSGFYAWVR